MKVSREMEIDIRHGHNLRIAPATGTTLHPETRAQTRLSNSHDGFLPDLVQPIC